MNGKYIDNWPCSIDTYRYFIISILPITIFGDRDSAVFGKNVHHCIGTLCRFYQFSTEWLLFVLQDKRNPQESAFSVRGSHESSVWGGRKQPGRNGFPGVLPGMEIDSESTLNGARCDCVNSVNICASENNSGYLLVKPHIYTFPHIWGGFIPMEEVTPYSCSTHPQKTNKLGQSYCSALVHCTARRHGKPGSCETSHIF